VPVALLLLHCAAPPPGTDVPALDYGVFVTDVEPVLVEQCAYSGCHGDPARPMHVFAPAGERLAEGLPADELTSEEHRANFDRVRVWTARTNAELPDLLRKPLQQTAGGSGHGGQDRYGQNLFASKDDPGYVALAAWIGGKKNDYDAGVEDAGTYVPPPDAGPPMCAGCGVSYATDIKPFIDTTDTTCGGANCHQPGSDAGCGYQVSGIGSLMGGGCDTRPNMLPCETWTTCPDIRMKITNKLLYYACTGHQGRFSTAQAQKLMQWVQCGAAP
jgi:hypothetical protein